MKKITSVLNSPLRIGIFALIIVLIISAIAIGSMQVGASINANKAIGIDKGVNVALKDAGFKSENVSNLKASLDNDDGIATYDIEFIANGFEYDYTIKASDGTILEAKREQVEKLSSTPLNNNPVQTPPSQNQQVQEPSINQNNGSSNSSSPAPQSSYIGVDKAKTIALKDAGVSSSQAKFKKAKLDKEDGIRIYEIEFYTSTTEYEYEINASTGKILSKDIEGFDHDDDFDYDDDFDDDDFDD